MKSQSKIQAVMWSALLAAGVTLALPARAQDDAGAEKKPRAERPERPAGGQRGDQVARLKEQLGLTDAQVEQLKPIFAAQAKELQALRKEAGPDADRAALREKSEAIREKYKPQIAAVLTAEQKEKLAKLQERRGGPGGQRRDGAGGPPPPPPPPAE